MEGGDPEDYFEPPRPPNEQAGPPGRQKDASFPWKWAIGCFGPILLLVLLVFAIDQCGKQHPPPCGGFPYQNTASGVVCGPLP